MRQHTIKTSMTAKGIGLHTGAAVTMTLKPGKINSGILFRRTDIAGQPQIKAQVEAVAPSPLCTTLADGRVQVGTIEHLLAAVAALEIDNLVVELDGAEVPIFDGSAEPFMFLLESAGRRMQFAARRVLRVLRPVEYRDGDKWARLIPAAAYSLHASIDFADSVIGQQSATLSEFSAGQFKAQLAAARTFTRAADVAQLRAAGLVQGGSLANAVVVDGATVLNPEGLRMEDECVRHKLLDAVGDLALAGYPLQARYEGFKAGHYMHFRLLQELFADADNYVIETVQPRVESRDTQAIQQESHIGRVAA
ncbi:MAG: UDP-3-O-acyl-N-acetylglucosamine deacetylase [Alphaproteobacteria bacterium]|jgi:UDP-3-O-[3-hydroxymyristoyl] N-acetylglucosamine deacetylase|nr:UDP-3-O-acyl-N-acetylglucosamine deacetylase [Alphaproteobacteria bacterium]